MHREFKFLFRKAATRFPAALSSTKKIGGVGKLSAQKKKTFYIFQKQTGSGGGGGGLEVERANQEHSLSLRQGWNLKFHSPNFLIACQKPFPVVLPTKTAAASLLIVSPPKFPSFRRRQVAETNFLKEPPKERAELIILHLHRGKHVLSPGDTWSPFFSLSFPSAPRLFCMKCTWGVTRNPLAVTVSEAEWRN